MTEVSCDFFLAYITFLWHWLKSNLIRKISLKPIYYITLTDGQRMMMDDKKPLDMAPIRFLYKLEHA